jgi:hypothetical protein
MMINAAEPFGSLLSPVRTTQPDGQTRTLTPIGTGETDHV